MEEDRVVNVLGRIKGITNNQQDLDEFYLIASEFGDIAETFCKSLQQKINKVLKEIDITSLQAPRILKLMKMLKNLKAVFQENVVKFEQKNVQDLYGLLTKKVLLQHLTENFLSLKNMGQIKGQLKYNNSVEEGFWEISQSRTLF